MLSVTLGEGGDFHHPETFGIDGENRSLINHPRVSAEH